MEKNRIPMSSVKIRYAKKSEMEQVWALERQNLYEYWNMHPCTDAPPKKSKLRKIHKEGVQSIYDPEEHKILVAVYKEKVIGLAWYGVSKASILDFESGFLYSIVVSPEYRNSAVATRLLNEFKRRVKRAGVKYVRLSVLHKNNRALNLYRKLGFFDERHTMLARLEPTGPEKAKLEARERKKRG